MAVWPQAFKLKKLDIILQILVKKKAYSCQYHFFKIFHKFRIGHQSTMLEEQEELKKEMKRIL